MKVILAGMSKTGTKSMVVALQELGMIVYDYMEHYTYLGDDWKKICKSGGTIEDFRRMYQGVDATIDLPSWNFWEQLSQAFPDAKIVLTMRENEDVWYRSLQTQHELLHSPIMIMMYYLSPTYRKFYAYGTLMGMTAYGIRTESGFKIDNINELVAKMVYRRHNTYVLQKAPKDKLLIYNVKEGWEPLCKFLGVDVPSKPFPHKNVRGNIVEEVMATNPLFIRMQREMMVSLSVLALLAGYGCYRAVKSSPRIWLSSCCDFTRPFLEKLMFWK